MDLIIAQVNETLLYLNEIIVKKWDKIHDVKKYHILIQIINQKLFILITLKCMNGGDAKEKALQLKDFLEYLDIIVNSLESIVDPLFKDLPDHLSKIDTARTKIAKQGGKSLNGIIRTSNLDCPKKKGGYCECQLLNEDTNTIGDSSFQEGYSNTIGDSSFKGGSVAIKKGGGAVQVVGGNVKFQIQETVFSANLNPPDTTPLLLNFSRHLSQDVMNARDINHEDQIDYLKSMLDVYKPLYSSLKTLLKYKGPKGDSANLTIESLLDEASKLDIKMPITEFNPPTTSLSFNSLYKVNLNAMNIDQEWIKLAISLLLAYKSHLVQWEEYYCKYANAFNEVTF